MKKSILRTALFLFVSTLMISCSKDDDTPSFQEENFLNAYLAATNFNEANVSFINSGSYEFGLEFSPIVKGSMTSLRVQLPEANPSLRVTIWDKDAGTIIKTEIVNVAIANTVYNVDIVDIPLVKDKVYAVSMNSNDWFERKKTDETVATYPITAGNIKVINYLWLSGVSQTYPTIVATDYYAGDLSFNFLQQQ